MTVFLRPPGTARAFRVAQTSHFQPHSSLPSASLRLMSIPQCEVTAIGLLLVHGVLFDMLIHYLGIVASCQGRNILAEPLGTISPASSTCSCPKSSPELAQLLSILLSCPKSECQLILPMLTLADPRPYGRYEISEQEGMTGTPRTLNEEGTTIPHLPPT